MKNFFKKNLLIIAIYFFIFLLLIYTGRNLRLYIDDNVMIFPVVLKSIFSHFIQFNYDQGFSRPFALISYYFIYSIFTFSPFIAHSILILLHTINAGLLFRILKKFNTHSKLSLLISLVFLSFPFATELFYFLANIHGIIVIFLFLIQIEILNSSLGLNKKIVLIFLLTLISVFTYELTFFLWIPLTYALFNQSKNKKSSFLYLSLFILPNFLYLLFSKIIFPPHILNPRSASINLFTLKNNFVNLLENIKYLFFNKDSWLNFWQQNFKDGLVISNNTLLLKIILIIFICLLCNYLVRKNHRIISYINEKNSVIFWGLLFLFSLLPLLFVEGFNFPFRALFMPSILFFIFIIMILNLFVPKLQNNQPFLFLMMAIVCFFVIIDVGIADKYNKQITFDESLTKSIKQTIRSVGFSDQYPTYLIINNLPHSIVYKKFLQGDHILSCYNYYWCAQASLNMITGVVKDIGIKFVDESFSSKTELPYREFINKRPLTIMSFTDNQSCLTGECLKVEAVYQKPY